MVYIRPMYDLVKSATFDAWLRSLRDRQAKARIEVRIRRLSLGNPGQYRALQGGLCELKIDAGPGYRVYYTLRHNTLILLLCGGDKSSQPDDIKHAMQIASQWDAQR